MTKQEDEKSRKESPLDFSAADLPAILPVFPLPGSILMPRCHLPLNIFEPRYLRMVLHAMATDRMIGMLQPKEPESGGNAPPLYAIGGAGRIVAYEETPDQRLLITLKGISRFQMEAEVAAGAEPGGFRQVKACWEPFAADLAEREEKPAAQPDAARLVKVLKTYVARRNLELDMKVLKEVPPALMVDVLAMTLPLEVRDKQALLEAPDPASRGEMLTGLMEMDILASIGSGGDGSLNG